MPTNILLKRFRVLIISRLFLAAFLLFYAQFVFPAEGITFYATIASISVLSIFYIFWLIWGRYLKLFGYVQIACDLILESILIYYTGGADSLFATIYVLSILSAGPIISPLASFYVATGSSICFIATVLLLSSGWAFPGLSAPATYYVTRWDPVYVFYATYVRITVFYLVAVLTYYFSQMIKQLEGKMKTQERLVFLGEVVSSIAHEIRNPLASISGCAELLKKQLNSKLSDRDQRLMSAIVDESDRINRIFSNLLDYSRLPELQIEEIDVEPYLDQIFMLMQHQKSFKATVKIETLYKGKNIKMRVDPEYLKQVFMNIISNAFEAMANGGCLKVTSSANHAYILIGVEDTGCGMDKKTLKSIFIPFKTTKRDGTGLGLAQAHKIVSQHGGKMEVRSQKGKGTKIEVFLPKA
ncbi:MAG: hypothetical protein A3C35_05900 [Omnitrophica bacterium RIFCSPHIGHO2_02_FULL_46_11]|nr:MAG: hypothetical protein A3C35_05900 [Omnitrophica bacterium RIFCSPHIGHO2_02_FULL_46_11]